MRARALVRPAVLTLVAPMSGTGTGALEALLATCASPFLGGAEVVVGVDPARAGDVTERAAASGASVSVVSTSPDDVGPLLAAVRTAYLAPVPSAGDPATASTRLARCVAGLESNPGATVAGSGNSGFERGVPTLVDGRSLAAAALARGCSPHDGFDAVVARTAALGSERSLVGFHCGGVGDWTDVLALRLMLRGLVWCDEVAGGPRVADGPPAARAERLASGAVLDEARALGLLPRGDGARLALTAIVVAEDPGTLRGGRLLALASARRASALVERVVVLEDGPESPAVPVEGVEWRQVARHGREAALDELAGALGPAVVLHAGEELVVGDAGQFAARLAELGNGSPGFLRTPSGVEARVANGRAARSEPRAQPPGGEAIRSARVAPLGGDGDWLRVAAGSARVAARRRTRFAVLAPDYTGGSGGSVALHRLCDLLNARGCDASIVPLEAAGIVNPSWRTPVIERTGALPDDTIAIYPEVVVGNPLGARRVVRWLLNRPGRLNGGRAMQERAEDLLVAYDPQIDRSLPVLWVPIIDPTVFFPKDRPGRGRLLWIGKGEVPSELDRSVTTHVTRSWPATKADLADALRAADVFVTCDWLTALIGESLMCATPVVLVDGQEWSPDVLGCFDAAARRGIVRSCEKDGAIERARAGAAAFHGAYTGRYERAADGIDAFVDLVGEHFAGV